uniref:Uncharacterized protein n=1 Tax=Physcomitrium patens TaxID=3218 RepID=A0A2K1KKQ0_PHYPA|nr:hypothetical protein PHYPA_008041 [Physcomitrium patens]
MDHHGANVKPMNDCNSSMRPKGMTLFQGHLFDVFDQCYSANKNRIVFELHHVQEYVSSPTDNSFHQSSSAWANFEYVMGQLFIGSTYTFQHI